MTHVEKCWKCGKEYKLDVKEAPKGTTKCDSIGAEIFENVSTNTYDDDSVDEHLMKCCSVFNALPWQVALLSQYLFKMIPAFVIGGFAHAFSLSIV